MVYGFEGAKIDDEYEMYPWWKGASYGCDTGWEAKLARRVRVFGVFRGSIILLLNNLGGMNFLDFFSFFNEEEGKVSIDLI